MLDRVIPRARFLAAGLGILSLTGCAISRMPILNPVGPVAGKQTELLLIATVTMLLIVVPIILATLWVVWRYRASAKSVDYDPEFTSSRTLGAVVLFVPLITVAVIGAITWFSTHDLDPYKPIAGKQAPLEIQAVGLDFKWLFIYPEQGIATVNDLVVPVDRPVTIRLSSDPMMTSLFVPGLITQIYAMPGMETRTNFLADRTIELQGRNGNYSGLGFSHQHFKTRVLTSEDFEHWLRKVDASPNMLDRAAYDALVKPTDGYPVTAYRSAQPGLFVDIIKKYSPAHTPPARLAAAAPSVDADNEHQEGHH
ncbi:MULTISPECIES: ubiquinol oxidase subunit II [Lysobacter]|uniref:ubiquinol oxidase subunit II n=1 Tax=Lysobacter TaxID=68 RepID=UPI001F4727CC|nr:MULTISPECIES: ubiquinol oxidase subunit II [Lysobacter]UJB18743.1 COX aromatic rich motif-containing protein [Lysobacter capsici]UJQ27532.1 COX aromatic rich motif-containing protein [Lysobacter gummosus]